MKAWKLPLGSIVFVACALAGPAEGATGNPWYDDFEAYNTAKGTAYTASPDAAILAWQESLMLRSYLNLYAATKQTKWLDEFTGHMVDVLDAADYADGDGYRDWTTARYSPDFVTNGNFEAAATGDATLPGGWTRDGSSTATAFRSNAAGTYVSGGACSAATWGLALVTANGSPQRLYQVLADYKPNHKHQLSIYAKNSGTSVHGRAFVYDRTTLSLLGSVEVTGTSWKNYTVDFTAPPAGHTVEVWLSHFATSPADQITYFDNVRVAAYYSYHVLDGMIGIPMANFVRLVDQNPATLAAYQDEADDYQAFLEDEVIAKWSDSSAFYGDTWVDASGTEGYYREPSGHDTFSTGVLLDPLPYNQYFALIEVQNILSQVNGNATYLARAEKGARYFRNRLPSVGATEPYTWYYAVYPDAKVEDASHANVDMEFITEMYLSGSVFTGADMEKFTNTLILNLWNGSVSAPELNNHVNGTQGSYCTNYMFSTIMYGWIPYAQFDPAAWEIAARQYDGVPVSNHTSALTLSQIIRWDPVKLVNQGFELAASDDATLPARWSRFLSTATTAYRDAANKSSGDYGLTLVSNGSSWQKLVQPWPEYVASASYTVTFDGKADGSGAGGRVWIYNETTATTIASYNFSNTAWQTHSFTFTAPAIAGQVVKIQLGHLDYQVSNGQTHYDNVIIKRTGDTW
ncbi:MAG TPA: hypothetical protein VGD81_10310 [Opitutaceae bacterium]